MNNKPSVTIGYGILDINRELLQLDLSESMTYIGRHSLIQYMFEKEDVTSFTMEELKPLIDYMLNHGGIEDITGRIYFSYQDKNKSEAHPEKFVSQTASLLLVWLLINKLKYSQKLLTFKLLEGLLFLS